MDTGTTMTVGKEGTETAEGALLTVLLEAQRIRARTGTVRGASNRIGATAEIGNHTAAIVKVATQRQSQERDGGRLQPVGRSRRRVLRVSAGTTAVRSRRSIYQLRRCACEKIVVASLQRTETGG